MPKLNKSRREFMKQSFAGLGVLSAASVFQSCSRPARPPNLIFLLTDDQRWDMLGCMGNSIIQTPNIDAMAADGVLFENAFVTTAICCTSRASVFLGQYARRHKINDFVTDLSPEQMAISYPRQLRQAGYHIGFIGKYGVGNNLPEKEWDFWRGVPGQPKYENIDSEGKPIHYTALCGDQALEFLDGCPEDKPFHLSISFKAPHVQDGDPRQFIADPQYDDLYSGVTIPPPGTATEASLRAQPAFMQDESTVPRKRWHLRFENPELYQRMVKNYYRLVTGVDGVVGRIRESLEKRGVAENTVIMLLGDNGFFLGERGLAGKWYGHEESIRVPLVVYDPRLPKSAQGQRREEMALNIDVAPTLLDLAGVTIPEKMQGKSLSPLITGKTPDWRYEFFYEHLFKVPEEWVEEAGQIPSSVGLRTEQYKYLRYIDQNPVFEELYDLQNDPQEENNLAGNPAYSEWLQQFRDRCDFLIREKE